MRDGILTIDVDAEIRKLSGQRFKSAGDFAVELIRYAAARAPTLIDVKVTRGGFSLTHDGRGLSMGALKRLVTIFDPSRSAEGRHRALVDLEEEEGLGLLAPFSVPGGKVSFCGPVGPKRRGVEFSPRHGARSFDASAADDTTITVRGGGRKPAVERRLIEEACRFSILPVRLNGRRVSNGPRLDDQLLDVDIRNARLMGTVGVPGKSELTRVIRLRNGIVLEDKLRPPVNGLVFHAVIDERDDDFQASWETLRRAARRLYHRLAIKYDELGDEGRRRALSLLFDRYRHTSDPVLMAGVRAFKLVGGAPLDLEGIRARTGRLFAIDVLEPLKRYDVEGRQVLRLDGDQRHFLEEVLGTPLLPPPALRERGDPASRIRDGARHLLRRITDPFLSSPGRPVRESRLEPAERAFIQAISDEVRSGAFSLPGEARPFAVRVRMAEGQRRPWVRVERKDGRREYRVSREHPLVVRMVEAVERDHAYVYPTLVALTEGHDGYGDTREAFQRAVLERHGLA